MEKVSDHGDQAGMGPLVTTFYAVIGRLLAGEIKAWLPWLTERITRIAVKELPEDMKERYGEEWRSHLNDVPGELARLTLALGFVKTSFSSSANEVLMGLLTRVLGLAGLAMMFPVLFVVGVVIKSTSRGPMLYRREVVGRGGRRFDVFTFRTMRTDPFETPGLESLKKSKLRRDPRVTSIGRFLRRSRLDYFPLSLNVVRGEMAIVGTTPVSIIDVELLDKEDHPGFRERLTVKPGITGWYQVAGTGRSFDEMLDSDLYYVRNRSLRFDLKIIARTVVVALTGKRTRRQLVKLVSPKS